MKDREIVHEFMLQLDVEFFDNLIELISNDNPFIRMDVALHISKSKDTRFINHLEKLFKDEEFSVRVAAVKAWCKVKRISDYKVHEVLYEK